jgi:hypothetical protein
MKIKLKVVETYGKKNHIINDAYGYRCIYSKNVLRLIKVFNLLKLKCEYVIQISSIDYEYDHRTERSILFNTWTNCDINKVKIPLELSRYLKIKKLKYEMCK